MYTLECELVTRASLSRTFAVFENPYNLARITPPGLGFRILTQGLVMASGAEIDYELRWLGLPLKWQTRITSYDPPREFVDEATRSPYRFWRHRHSFYASPEGTVVADRVDYDLPMGPLGRIAHGVVVGRQLRRIFEFRQQAIAGLLEAEVVSVQPPAIRRRSQAKVTPLSPATF